MKKNKHVAATLLLLLIFAIGGCAGKQMELSLDTPDVSSSVSGVNYVIEPVDSLGLFVTEAMKKGEVTILKGVFPIVLGGEYFICRIRWNGITIQKDGREFFTQFLLSPEGGRLTWTIVIDGYPDETGKTMALSSLVEYTYDAFGQEFIVARDDFSEKFDYRKSFILENGTPINELRRVDFRDFLRSVKNWNVIKTQKGDILAPLSTENMQQIAQINPQYAEWEKRLSESHASIFYADPISIGVFNALETIRTENKIKNGGVPSVGWDFRSVLPNRRAMGKIIEAFENMRQEKYKRNS